MAEAPADIQELLLLHQDGDLDPEPAQRLQGLMEEDAAHRQAAIV
ncbi:MAG: hypothetical protein ACOCYV_02995 [Planctomycetota bacterium]